MDATEIASILLEKVEKKVGVLVKKLLKILNADPARGGNCYPQKLWKADDKKLSINSVDNSVINFFSCG